MGNDGRDTFTRVSYYTPFTFYLPRPLEEWLVQIRKLLHSLHTGVSTSWSQHQQEQSKKRKQNDPVHIGTPFTEKCLLFFSMFSKTYISTGAQLTSCHWAPPTQRMEIKFIINFPNKSNLATTKICSQCHRSRHVDCISSWRCWRCPCAYPSPPSTGPLLLRSLSQ